MADTRVKGLSDFNAFMQTLPVKVERNLLRGGLRAGMKTVLPVVKANARKDTGLMAQGMKISTSAKDGRVVAKIKATGPHGYLAPWFEYGTAAHKIVAKDGGYLLVAGDTFVTSVTHPGMAPQPFMAPALYSQMRPATVATAQYLKRRLATKHGLDTADIEVDTE